MDALELTVTDHQLHALIEVRDHGWRYLTRELPGAYRMILGPALARSLMDAHAAGRPVTCRTGAASVTLNPQEHTA